MEGHAAFPHAEDEGDVARRPEQFSGLEGDGVEQDVADTPAEQDADHRVESEIVDIGALQRTVLGSAPHLGSDADPHGIPPADHKAEDIAQRIPADREFEHRHGKRSRVDAGERNFQGKIHEATL